MKKIPKAGFIFGGLSVLTPILSYILFLKTRGPNADIYFMITVFGILSVVGILLAVLSYGLSKRLVLPIIGLLGNGVVLVFTYFLLLAMGISEP
ncbi:hypothetical protein ACQKMV_11585 [Lysinibacillus sp. NPDC094403]|uniref:hypothetical protein n=1 Tax=Lysinibacillus sp. NPDC094403 TaxID=3390581 RepID=UPI003D085073